MVNDASTPRRPAHLVTLLSAVLVLCGVLYAGFLRVLDTVAETPVTSSTPAPAATTPTGVQQAPATGSAASASGSIPLPPDNAGLPAEPEKQQNTSAVPEPPVDPVNWPASLPELGEHKVIDHLSGPEERWVIEVPGNSQLAGGGFLADLKESGWKVTTVATPNTVTAVAELDRSRVSVSLRPGEASTPAGWSRMEVVYLDRVPDFDIPTTTPPPTDEEAARKRS